MSDWLAPVIGGAASVLNTITNQQSQREANEANMAAVQEYNRGQMELAQYQNAFNLDQWNRQNAYNTPVAQMARYQEAGLNPHLIYGNGQASAGNATNHVQASTPALRAADVHQSVGPAIDAASFQNALMSYYTADKMKAEADSIREHTVLTHEQATSERIRQIGMNYANAKTKEEAAIWKEKLNQALERSILDNQRSAFELGFRRETARPMFDAEYANKMASTDYLNARTDWTKSDRLLMGARQQLLQAQAFNQTQQALSAEFERLNIAPKRAQKITEEIANLKKDGTYKDYQNRLKDILINNGLKLDGGIESAIDRLGFALQQTFFPR